MLQIGLALRFRINFFVLGCTLFIVSNQACIHQLKLGAFNYIAARASLETAVEHCRQADAQSL